jgi:signal transduction histidine kinase
MSQMTWPSAEAVIAQDLHDSVCQTLAGTCFLLATLARELEKGGSIDAAELRRATELLREAMNELRAITPDVVREGLWEALKSLDNTETIKCTIAIAPDLQEPGVSSALILYRLVRWARRWAAKTARPISIQFLTEEGRLVMAITDGAAEGFRSLSDHDFHLLQQYARDGGVTLERPDSGDLLVAVTNSVVSEKPPPPRRAAI